MSDFFFAKLNEDGTYGEPIKSEIVDFDLVRPGIVDEKRNHHIDWLDGTEVTFELDYKQTKDFVWKFILNLKRSTKHLMSKNLVKGGDS